MSAQLQYDKNHAAGRKAEVAEARNNAIKYYEASAAATLPVAAVMDTALKRWLVTDADSMTPGPPFNIKLGLNKLLLQYWFKDLRCAYKTSVCLISDALCGLLHCNFQFYNFSQVAIKAPNYPCTKTSVTTSTMTLTQQGVSTTTYCTSASCTTGDPALPDPGYVPDGSPCGSNQVGLFSNNWSFYCFHV